MSFSMLMQTNLTRAVAGQARKGQQSTFGTPWQGGRRPLSVSNILGRCFTMWHSDFGAVVETDIGKLDWMAFREKADKRYGNAGGLRKNSLHIGASLAFAWKAGKRPVSLEQVCATILEPDNYV